MAAAGRWYCFDQYRSLNRLKSAPWNATTNPQIPAAQQCYLETGPDLVASTGVFTQNTGVEWAAVGSAPPPPSNGDLVVFSKTTDGGSNGTLPAGVADGTVGYIVNLSLGIGLHGRDSSATPKPTWQVSATQGGAPMSFSTDTTNVNMPTRPQSAANYSVASQPGDYLSFPYFPDWGNYTPVHVSVIMMARVAGNAAATPAIRDGALAFTAPMDSDGNTYYSAFDMATTA